MLEFFLIVGGLIYLATMYIKQKYGTLDTFVEEAKKQLSGDEEKEPDVFEDPNFPPEPSNLVAPSPEEPDVEAQEAVPEPTQEQLSKWKELEEMCKPGGYGLSIPGLRLMKRPVNSSPSMKISIVVTNNRGKMKVSVSMGNKNRFVVFLTKIYAMLKPIRKKW